jgi:hypothetical protein
MPIQIIDNFDLNSPRPIDNRFVVGSQSFYTHRDYITWKYVGMRVWDLNDGPYGTPYVWTGTTFSNENSVAITGSGTVNKLPKFLTSLSLGDSSIYDDGTKVGIFTTSPSYELDVTGKINTTLGFYGDGQNITNINATNILTGILSLNRLQNSPSPGFLLTSGVGGSGQSTWVDSNSITVGNANKLSSSKNIFGQPFDGSQDVSGTLDLGGQSGKSILNITGSLQFKNSNGGLLNIVYTGTSNINRTYTLPGANANRTFAFLEQSQTFSGLNTFSSFTNFTDPIQVIGTASFIVPFTTFFGTSYRQSLSVIYSGIEVGSNTTITNPTSGTMSFSTNNTQRMKISNEGISLFSSVPKVSWSVTSLSSDRWVSDLSGTTSGSAVDLDSVAYDRIIYANHVTTGVCQVDIYVETTTSNFALLSRCSPNGYSTANCIIPAGKKFRIFLDSVSGSADINFIIYKLGIN